MNTYTVWDDLMDALSYHGKSVEDVKWVGSKDFSVPLDNFYNLCRKIPYTEDSDIPTDLLVVGEDFWLERVFVNHDAIGLWQYRTFPVKPEKEFQLSTLSLSDLSWEEQRQACDELEHRYPDGVGYTPDTSYDMLWMMLYKK